MDASGLGVLVRNPEKGQVGGMGQVQVWPGGHLRPMEKAGESRIRERGVRGRALHV